MSLFFKSTKQKKQVYHIARKYTEDTKREGQHMKRIVQLVTPYCNDEVVNAADPANGVTTVHTTKLASFGSGDMCHKCAEKAFGKHWRSRF